MINAWSSWWLLWFVFILLFLVPSIGYGWGYRGWGPPYPRYIQRRRAEQAALGGDTETLRHHSWGWRGDVVWMVFFAGVIGFVMAAWLL
jgi:hypothetical protein